MPRVFLTPFVILGVVLLSSCSNSQEPKPTATTQAKSECEKAKETYDKFNKISASQTDATNPQYRYLSLVMNYYLLEESKCFTAMEIATAKANIDFQKSQLNK